MNRREFLSSVATVSAAALGAFPWLSAVAAVGVSAPHLEGFIVSDAHFGWRNEQQPSPTELTRSH